MPIYNYRCENCSAEFEKILPIGERDHPEMCCPVCESGDVHRIVSRSSFSLKGEGWYKDGYQKGKTNEAD